jgi:Wiskott-Aldrich syndrome protein
VPPQAVHAPGVRVAVSRPEQAKPVLQVPVPPEPQQDWPEPPQVEQMLPVDFRTQDPEVHWVAPPPVQQAWPSPPQAPHLPAFPVAESRPEQAKPVLQVPVLPVPQQAWPSAPQVEHTLPVDETMQDSPVSHVLPPPPGPPPPPPGQQAWPAPPHALQVRAPASTPVSAMQPSPDWQALVPGQQAAPAAPQLSQVLVLPDRLHAKPELHVLFEQQA